MEFLKWLVKDFFFLDEIVLKTTEKSVTVSICSSVKFWTCF